MVYWLSLVIAVAAEKTILAKANEGMHSDSKKHIAAGDDPRHLTLAMTKNTPVIRKPGAGTQRRANTQQ